MTANNDNQSLHNQQNCRSDPNLLTDAFHLAVLDVCRKDSHLCTDGNQRFEANCALNTDSNNKEVYFQSPYALSSVRRQMSNQSDIDMTSLQHSLTPHQRHRPEHTYDIPFPPKWV